MEEESVEALVLEIFSLNDIDDVKEGNKRGTTLWKQHTDEYDQPLIVNTAHEKAFEGYTNDVLYLAAMRLVDKGLLRLATAGSGKHEALFIVQTPVEIVKVKLDKLKKRGII